jgi:hypothetical protein
MTACPVLSVLVSLFQVFCLPETKGQTMHDISSKFHSKPQLRQQHNVTYYTTIEIGRQRELWSS